MGLTTWKNVPDGRILKSDVSTAKNYLNEKQIKRLERNVSMFFDHVEDLVAEESSRWLSLHSALMIFFLSGSLIF